MSKEDKNIYDLFNEVKFDITEEKEIPINDIEKKRIKKIIKNKIKVKPVWRNKKVIASIALFIIALFTISPIGRETIAAIAEKFFFNPGLGLISVKEELYVLKEPIMIESENKEILIKGIVSNKKGLNIQLWINNESREELSKEEILNFEDVRNFIHINTGNDKDIELTSIATAGGGSNYFISIWCDSNKLIKNIGIQVYDSYKEVVLNKIEDGSELYDVGGSDTDNDFFIGGNKYILEDKTYITLWSDYEYTNNNMVQFSINKENIKVTDLEGGSYEISHSQYAGNSKEFVIDEKIDKPISVLINKSTLDYRLKTPINIRLDIPKKGQTIEVNKEIYIEEVDEKILLKSIKSTEEGIEINFDSGEFKKDNTYIVILGQERSSWAHGSTEDKIITLGINNDRLTAIEKITGSINLKIKRVMLDKSGEWRFNIK